MGAPIVKLGGLTMAGANSYDWEMIPGTRPVVRDYTVSIVQPGALKALQSLLGFARHFSVTGIRRPINVEQCSFIALYPGTNPFEMRISIADTRWRWPKKHIDMSFNVRRATGDLFLLNADVLENAVIQPEIEYAKWSLNVNTPHTATTMLKKVFTALQTAWRFEDNADAATFGDVEVENVEIDDNGADAVERVLAYLPGADVYIDRFGVAVIYDTARVLTEVSPDFQQVNQGFSTMADLRALRPKYVDVLFTREPEIRFNFAGDRAGATVPVDADSNSLINVMQVVASTLEVNGVKLARGSWLPIDDWLDAIGLSPEGVALTQADIRQFFLAGRMGEFTTYLIGLDQSAHPVWLRRIDMIRMNWRRTFQVAPIFWQRLRGLSPVRSSYLNFATGARAPSEVYCDYIRRPSYKTKNFIKGGGSPTDTIGWAVRGYSDLLADCQAAPIGVEIADQNAGVIRVVPRMEPDGGTDDTTLGFPTQAFGLPPANLGELNRALDIFRRWDEIVLEDDFRLAVVLTTIPASPNDSSKLYRVRVEPQDTSFKLDAATCKGPPVEVRVFPGITTARMAWFDGAAAVGGGTMVEAITADLDAVWPEEQVSNPFHLSDIAKAAASRVYEPILDRPYGSATFDMNPEFKLQGNMRSVRHDMAGGAATTTVTYGAPQQAKNLWRFLDANTRKAIRRNLGSRGSEDFN